jgi:hypothetical protein
VTQKNTLAYYGIDTLYGSLFFNTGPLTNNCGQVQELRGDHHEGFLALALLAIVRIGRNGLPGTNAIASFASSSMA